MHQTGQLTLQSGSGTPISVDIADDDSGKVFIYSNNADAMNRAVQEIDALCGGGAKILKLHFIPPKNENKLFYLIIPW